MNFEKIMASRGSTAATNVAYQYNKTMSLFAKDIEDKNKPRSISISSRRKWNMMQTLKILRRGESPFAPVTACNNLRLKNA